MQKENPKTFSEMLHPRRGNPLQKMVKIWITPQDPEGTIKLMKKLRVDKVQKQIKTLRLSVVPKKTIQSNYTLGSTDVNSMLDFATNQATINEIVHLAFANLSFLWLILMLGYQERSAIVISNALLVYIHIYLVLGQRYSRVRLNLVIDKAFRNGKQVNVTTYKNHLDLDLS